MRKDVAEVKKPISPAYSKVKRVLLEIQSEMGARCRAYKGTRMRRVIIGVILFSLLANPLNVSAMEMKRCTCYCEPGITASGHYTRPGIVAGRRADLGKVAAIYKVNDDGSMGEFIGYYEFLDTGAGIDTDGDGKGDSIKKGLSIDVFRKSMDDVNSWIAEYGDYVYIEYIDAKG
jgi:hypothetical protein